MDLIYTTHMYQTSISVEDYLEEYVDVPAFLECCKACGNYNRLWSCPEFDFDVMEYWKNYETLDITGVRIQFDDSMIHRTYKEEEITRIINSSVWKEKEKLSKYLMGKEKIYRKVSAFLREAVWNVGRNIVLKKKDFHAVIRKSCVIPLKHWEEM